jgi:hypothetical protein
MCNPSTFLLSVDLLTLACGIPTYDLVFSVRLRNGLKKSMISGIKTLHERLCYHIKGCLVKGRRDKQSMQKVRSIRSTPSYATEALGYKRYTFDANISMLTDIYCYSDAGLPLGKRPSEDNVAIGVDRY